VENQKKLANFIENPTNINAIDQSGLSALHYACETGNLEVVKDLIAKGANVNLPTIHVDSTTPIYLAAQHGHLEIVKELCDHGATVNIHTMDGKTVLRAALNMGKHETVYYLISKGADVNAKGTNKETALLDVTHYGNLKRETGVIQALLDAKANVNDQDISGKTPLMWVASRDVSWDVINLLLNAGADVEILDGQGRTAYYYAKDNPALRDSNKLNLLHQHSQK
jgi:ankyrin repeat protein